MSAEHLNEHGQLTQGYFCATCGKPCGMYGHMEKCKPNRALVKRIEGINKAGSLEAYTFNLLKEQSK